MSQLPEEVVLTGWLTKKGASIKNWKNRFFVLTTDTLCYYEDEMCTQLRGEIPVNTISHIRVRSPPLRGWIFEVEVPHRVYVFQAPTSRDMENWSKQIYSLNGCIAPPLVPEIVQRGLIKQGLLNKLGAVHKKWRTRYFELINFPDYQLIYSLADESRAQRGVIDLSDVIAVNRDVDTETCFDVETPDRVFQLEAETRHEMLEWVRLLGCAIREYNLKGSSLDRLYLSESQMRTSACLLREPTEMRRAAATRRLLHQGWLLKKGAVVRVWRNRYFVLQMISTGNPIIRYYLFPDTSMPQGTIELSRMKRLQYVEGTRRLEIHLPNRVFELEASTELEAAEWVTKIHHAASEEQDEF